MKIESQFPTTLSKIAFSAPEQIKMAFIEQDFKNMYGAREHQRFINSEWHLGIDWLFESAVYALGKTKKRNIIRNQWANMALVEYKELLKSGMFYEFFPQMSGEWEKDKMQFVEFIIDRETKKEWIESVLNPNYKD